MATFMDPLAFGMGAVDWQERIDVAALRSERSERAQEAMREQGLAVLLVSGADACRYLTGLKGPEFAPDLWYVLFFAEHPPVVFMLGGYHVMMPEQAPWITEWRFARSWLRGTPGEAATKAESRRFAADVLQELKSREVERERLGLVGFDARALSALEEAGISVVDGTQVIQEAMMIKTPMEILCMRMVAGITDRMWGALRRGVKSGMSDREATALALQAGQSAGAEDVRASIRAGVLARERGPKGTGQLITPGDLFYANLCGTSFFGYKACVYRTFVLDREPTASELEWMEILEERVFSIVSSLTPGATTDEAARMFEPASSWGYGDEAEVLTIEIAHGIGLHQYERPAINRQWSLDSPQELREGMIVAVESRQGVRGVGSVRLECMALITSEGPRVLDRFPTAISVI